MEAVIILIDGFDRSQTYDKVANSCKKHEEIKQQYMWENTTSQLTCWLIAALTFHKHRYDSPLITDLCLSNTRPNLLLLCNFLDSHPPFIAGSLNLKAYMMIAF